MMRPWGCAPSSLLVRHFDLPLSASCRRRVRVSPPSGGTMASTPAPRSRWVVPGPPRGAWRPVRIPLSPRLETRLHERRHRCERPDQGHAAFGRVHWIARPSRPMASPVSSSAWSAIHRRHRPHGRLALAVDVLVEQEGAHRRHEVHAPRRRLRVLGPVHDVPVGELAPHVHAGRCLGSPAGDPARHRHHDVPRGRGTCPPSTGSRGTAGPSAGTAPRPAARPGRPRGSSAPGAGSRSGR